jgi:ESCRT-I complex subunit TSG101
MMDLASTNAAIGDALYFLDRALYRGAVGCEEHLRQVRSLAKQQFLTRAHMHKIQQALLNQPQC